MAKKTTQPIDFGSSGGTRYPWNEWLDGSQWIAKRGEDHTVPDGRFRVTVNAAARKRGMVARTKLVKEGVVAFQAVPKSGSQPEPA